VRIVLAGFLCLTLFAQRQQIVFTDREKPIAERIKTLRTIADAKRGAATLQLALDVRGLPDSPNKVLLAWNLANLATEGDQDFRRSSKPPKRWTAP
jgi:hypothetical protein